MTCARGSVRGLTSGVRDRLKGRKCRWLKCAAESTSMSRFRHAESLTRGANTKRNSVRDSDKRLTERPIFGPQIPTYLSLAY